MDFYERIEAAFKKYKVNRAQVGREMGVTRPNVSQKLQRKSAVTPHEIEVYARHARMSVSEALGEMAVVLELKDEQDVVRIYRALTPEQKKNWVGVGLGMAGMDTPPTDDDEPPV